MTQTFAVSPSSVVYGVTTMPTITAPVTSSTGAITYAVTGGTASTRAGITSAGVITSIGSAGTSIITATQAASGNYAQSTYTATLTVTAGTPTLTGFGLSASSVSYGAAAPTIVAPTSPSTGAITYTSSNLGVATITTAGVITVVGAGTTTITATQAAAGNYGASTATTNLTVAALNNMWAATLSTYSAVLGGPVPTIIVNSSSSAPYSYSSSNTNIATIDSAGVISLVAPGSVSFTATQEQKAGYAASSQVTPTLKISAATASTLSLSLSSYNVLLGADPPTTNLNTNSVGGVSYSSSNTSVASIADDGSITMKSAGSVKFTVSQVFANDVLASTYTTPVLTIKTPAANNWTANLSSYTVTLGDAAPLLTTTTNSPGLFSYSSSNSAAATINASTGVITLVGPGEVYFAAFQGASGDYLKSNRTTSTLNVSLPDGYLKTPTVGTQGVLPPYLPPFNAQLSTEGWALNGPGTLTWSPIKSAALYTHSAGAAQCNQSIALGLSAGSWRLPTAGELAGLQNGYNQNPTFIKDLASSRDMVLSGTLYGDNPWMVFLTSVIPYSTLVVGPTRADGTLTCVYQR